MNGTYQAGPERKLLKRIQDAQIFIVKHESQIQEHRHDLPVSLIFHDFLCEPSISFYKDLPRAPLTFIQQKLFWSSLTRSRDKFHWIPRLDPISSKSSLPSTPLSPLWGGRCNISWAVTSSRDRPQPARSEHTVQVYTYRVYSTSANLQSQSSTVQMYSAGVHSRFLPARSAGPGGRWRSPRRWSHSSHLV